MTIEKLRAVGLLVFTLALMLPIQLNITEAHESPFDFVDVTETQLPDEQDEILWLARAIFSETKKRESGEMAMVAWVIRNRVDANHKGMTYKEVVLAPHQFSGLNSFDKQYRINVALDYDYGLENKAWRDALEVARGVYGASSFVRPFPKTVLHFYSPHTVAEPSWAKDQKPIYTILNDEKNLTRFAFYDNIK